MYIQSKYLGEVEIADEKIIQFSKGLPGFADERQFVLLDLPDNPVFQILQSVNSIDTAFIVTNPYLMYQSYEFKLDDSTLEHLEIRDEKDVSVFVVVTLKSPFPTSTLNLKAPIIINPTTKKGKQYILNIDDYSSRAPISPTYTADESRVK